MRIPNEAENLSQCSELANCWAIEASEFVCSRGKKFYLLQIFQTQSEAENFFYLMDTEDHSATDKAVGT
jgi:hypothetical protein